MYSHPGKKLVFMGGEFGQFIEWRIDDSLDWHLLGYEMHEKLHNYVKALNRFYLDNCALWQVERSWDGFKWIEADDSERSVISFIRRGKNKGEMVIAVLNFSINDYKNFYIGVPDEGTYLEVFNSDDEIYGGMGRLNLSRIDALSIPSNGYEKSILLDVPPLTSIFLKQAEVQG
jgi:1,4-alpha-glucan branching enzyme